VSKDAYLSGSCCSKTLRLVWSRIFMMLTKQPRSSFLGLNWAMAAVYLVFDGWRRRPAVQKLLRRMICQEVWYGGSQSGLHHAPGRRSDGGDEVDTLTRHATARTSYKDLSRILTQTLQYYLFALQASARASSVLHSRELLAKQFRVLSATWRPSSPRQT
jgi:hypothetical protein